MVSYQRWTSIAFDVAKSKGLSTGQESNRDMISVSAEIWRDRKDELSTATIAEAEKIARQEISIS